MNSPASEPVPDETSSAMKFTYPSGSRPLEGYTIKRGIGRGGFGEVYFAVSDAGKEVALKLIRRHLEVELRGVRQCLNLKHPNLLALHDIRSDEQDDRWVVMEYISGDSLEAAIDRNPNGMPEEELLDWFHGIVAGVAYLHDRGIVHRDLKPGNIFKDEGIIKIGDYGLAKFVSCSRRSGQTETVGTVHYMAPEISRGRYGKEVDTYALGIILYEMVTGRAPFEGESVAEVLMKHLDTPPDLSPLKSPFREITGKALEKNPDLRFKHVREMLAMLPGSAPVAAGAAGRAYHEPIDLSAHEVHVTDQDIPRASQPDEFVDHIEVIDEEPVWKWVRETFQQLSDAWHQADLNPVVRIILMIVGIIVVLSSSSFLFPLAFVLAISYGIYRAVRAIVLVSINPHSSHPKPRVHHPPAVHRQQNRGGNNIPRHARRTENWRREPQVPVAPPKSSRQKLTELTGSMLIAALVASIMSIVMMVLRQDNPMRAEEVVWMGLVGVVGSWLVMIPAKIWEGTEVEQTARRFTMLVAGLLLGSLAAGLAHIFDLTFNPVTTGLYSQWLGKGVSDNFYNATGGPTMLAFLAYFGFLMFILRWWRQADPARNTRVSLWSTAVSVFGAWVLYLFFPFPQPWGLMLATVIAVSVQLASPMAKRKPKEHWVEG